MERLLYALYPVLCRHSGGVVPPQILIILLLKSYIDNSISMK